MKKIILTTFLMFGFIFIQNADAKSFRVSQIPNGSKFSCMTCHTSPNGGARNAFGKAIEDDFLSGGNVVWNEVLAALDSDNDGFTNGEELQDPDGEWSSGSANPGDMDMVTNPGDATSHPDPNSVNELIANPVNVFPNPVADNINFDFKNYAGDKIEIFLYDNLGNKIADLYNGTNHSIINVDIRSLGLNLSSGIYYYKAVINRKTLSGKIVIN